MKFKYTLPSDSVGLQFWGAYSKWHSQVLEILKPLNINHTQFVILASILWCIDHEKSPTTQAEIARITGLDKMTLSKSLKGLILKGLIDKTKDTRDARSFSLNLTLKGEGLINAALVLIEELDTQYFKHLGDSRKLFISLLQKLRNE